MESLAYNIVLTSAIDIGVSSQLKRGPTAAYRVDYVVHVLDMDCFQTRYRYHEGMAGDALVTIKKVDILSEDTLQYN